MTYNKNSDAKVADEIIVEEKKEDVLTKTAKETGVGERTVARARQYSEIIKE